MRLRACLLVLVGLVVLGLPAGAAAEEGCPNEAVRQAETAAHAEGFASQLPDCRAYEQVTPLDKDGTNVSGWVNSVQASGSGGRIVFLVTADMPGGIGGDRPPYFLGSRGGEGWSDQGLEAQRQPNGISQVVGWSEDLSKAALTISEASLGSGGGLYLRDNAVGSLQLAVNTGLRIPVYPAGFSADDSRLFFETPAQLVPNGVGLYELHGGVVSSVGVLPGGGPGGSEFGGSGGVRSLAYLESEHAISSDGSRVFFTEAATQQIYVRENGTRTVSVGSGVFLSATPDGSKAFYLAASGDLFEFDVDSEQTSDLTPGGMARGLLGVSDDGSYLYFAANGVLTSSASSGNCQNEVCLYVWHDGAIGFIATLNESFGFGSLDGEGDADNWLLATSTQFAGIPIPKMSLVSSDGRVLLFRSHQRLTAYDNAGVNELYRYDAVHGRLVCVSCDPSGAPPSGPATLQSITPGFFRTLISQSILLRNLSSDGSRVFFESPDALLPRDTNGVQDVYEWEQQGVGGCQGSSETFSAVSGGCLYLVSSGRSPDKSFFADASANGSDAFIFTSQPLVGQDQDGLVDVYDARVGGGFAAQNPPVAQAPCEGEACRAPAGGVPQFGAPVSASFSGVGNQTPPASVVTVSKPKVKAKHKVVKRRHRKSKRRRARKASGDGRLARRAGTSTRGGK
jgi:hypothetical protein